MIEVGAERPYTGCTKTELVLELVRHRVNNHIDDELEGILGVVRRIFRIVCPLQSVPEVRVPRHENAYSLTLIEDGKYFGVFPGWTVLPLITAVTFRDFVVRHLDDFVDVVEAVKQRMRDIQLYG